MTLAPSPQPKQHRKGEILWVKNRLRLYITFYPKAQAGGMGDEAHPYVPLDAS